MWKKFWDGLNIRKFMSLFFSLLFAVVIMVVLVWATKEADRELIMWIVAPVSTILNLCVGYYFGYTNGQKTPIDENDSR